MSNEGFRDKPLDVRIHRRNGVARIQLSGALDAEGAARLRQELDRLSSDDPSAVLLDAREVAFADSSGLRVLLESLPGLDGQRVALLGLSAPIRRLLELTDSGSSLGGTDAFELMERFTGEEV